MDEFSDYCGESKSLLLRLNDYLQSKLGLVAELRFPYGNSYGWGVKYAKKSRHICDVFAENGSFTVMLRLTNAQCEQLYPDLTDYAKECIDRKYPCGEGGWLNCRILTEQQLCDATKMLALKAARGA
ncbi:MAG: DUF3788 domain-containing protein [Clostridia bacterium]|nr:DUF3788 domain-containing protein [Clostridia bacterium]